MNIIKEISKKTMTEEKRSEAKNDFFAFYIGRPLSYVLTVPFFKLKIKPNTVSFISIIPIIVGFILLSFGNNMILKLLGWFMFFLWNLLDGVDGNLARYTKQFSKTGSLWDATSGYIAMVLTFLSMGIGCFYGNFTFTSLDKEIFIILGSLSSIAIIFPRLIMHKRITSIGTDEKSSSLKNKNNYSILKIIALNLISVSGLIQVFMLISIIFKIMDLFTIVYFIINMLICLISVSKLLSD